MIWEKDEKGDKNWIGWMIWEKDEKGEEWNRWKRDKSGRFLKLEVKSVGLLEFAFSHSPEWNVLIQRQENYLDRWCWWELAIYLDQF